MDYAAIISEAERLLTKYFDKATIGQLCKMMLSSICEFVILANDML